MGQRQDDTKSTRNHRAASTTGASTHTNTRAGGMDRRREKKSSYATLIKASAERCPTNFMDDITNDGTLLPNFLSAFSLCSSLRDCLSISYLQALMTRAV